MENPEEVIETIQNPQTEDLQFELDTNINVCSIPKQSSGVPPRSTDVKESPVGDGTAACAPQPTEAESDDPYEGKITAGEGAAAEDDAPPSNVEQEQDDQELDVTDDDLEEAAGTSLPCDTQTKVNENLFVERLRMFVHSPTTWRIIKAVLVVAIAIKLFNSYEAIEHYVPSVFSPK